ncbi:MAG: putative lipoprotein [Moraxellaceae bacterium]|jgi:cell wall-associated NlpC family hydrolase|nr:putative lipoprotein [Moraxellaceae bacterium]
MRLLIILLALLLPATWAGAATDAAEESTSPLSHDDMVVVALSLIGTPYKFGGTTPETGFDCSGLVQYILGLSSPVTLPRNSDDMYREGVGRKVALKELKAGDLLFFKVGSKSQRVNHVAVYIGEDRFVHAPSQGGFVRVDKLDSKYWMRWFTAAKRVLPENDRLATNP